MFRMLSLVQSEVPCCDHDGVSPHLDVAVNTSMRAFCVSLSVLHSEVLRFPSVFRLESFLLFTLLSALNLEAWQEQKHLREEPFS